MQTQTPRSTLRLPSSDDYLSLLVAAVNVTANAIVITDRKANILWTNPAFTQLTGYSVEEVIGQNPRILQSGKHDRAFYRNLWETLLAGRTWKGEIINRRKDGTTYTEDMTISPVKDVDGEVTNFIAINQDISLRKQVEESLLESEAKFQDLFENAHDLIHSVDPEGHLLYTNRAWRETLGYSSEDLSQLTVFDVIAENHKQPCQDAFQRLLGGEDIGNICVTFVGKQGQRVDVEGRMNCRFVAGQPESTRGIFRDVTAVYQAEAERQRVLEEAQAQHAQGAAILTSLSEGVHVIDVKGNILYENPAAAALLGYEAGELIGKEAHSTIHHSRGDNTAYPKVECPIYATKNDGRAQQVRDEVFWRKDGTSLPVEYTTAALRDKHGALIGATVVFSDVTARKQAEQELRRAVEVAEEARQAAEEHAAFSASLAREANAIIITTTPEGLITSCNPKGEEMLGWTSAELVGKLTPAAFTDPKEVAVRAEELSVEQSTAIAPGFDVFTWKTRLTGGERREWTTVSKDGRRFPTLLSLSALRNRNEEITGYLGVSLDISLQKEAEKALQHARVAAEDAGRVRAEFTANMSHEIRTPVNGIMGMTELALQTDLSGEQREYLTAVQVSAESLLTVINEVLDFSKLDAGGLTLDPQPFDLREAMGDTMKIVAAQAHLKGLELVLDVSAEVPTRVHSDVARLRQCVVNLVSNSIKFTERGEVTTRVELEERAGSQPTLHFSVRDTGLGIPVEQQARIFEAYTQGDGSMSRRFGGTGLGLTITAKIVEAMGGKIWVESQPGQGSTFHFTISFEEAVPQVLSTALEAHQLVGRKVLIVDDNATNRKILLGMAAVWKMDAVAVDSAAAAQQVMRPSEGNSAPFDLILLDAQMPEKDGFALAQWIQENCEGTAPTIMMLSSVRGPGDVERCRRIGIQQFLTKPVKQSELLRAIVGLIKRPVAKLCTAHSPEEVGFAGNGRRVLLVEDNVVNQKLAEKMLQNLGLKVTIAGDGAQAVELWRLGHFSMVFMDVQMPVMDGFQATCAIRDAEAISGAHIPIVAMTAHVMAGDEQRCLDAGMDAYVSKPIRRSDLVTALIKVEELTLPAPTLA